MFAMSSIVEDVDLLLCLAPYTAEMIADTNVIENTIVGFFMSEKRINKNEPMLATAIVHPHNRKWKLLADTLPFACLIIAVMMSRLC
jgi:hypothetical protein